MAIDQQAEWLTWNGAVWSKPQPIQAAQPNNHCGSQCPPSFLNWVSCPTATFCVAVGSDGNAIEWNGTTWSAPQSVDPNLATSGQPLLGIDAVSCPAASFCVALFADGNAVIGRQAG